MKSNPSNQTLWAARSNILLGTVDLKQGRVDAAADRLEKIEPLLPKLSPASRSSGTSVAYWLLKTEAFLVNNQPVKAIEVGERIVPQNFRSMNISNMPYYNLPFLKDVVARAYWKMGDLDKAVAEYERLTTVDKTSQVRYLIHPLYHYRLGRVYEEKGEKAKAAGECEKFLEYWKDADPTHPEMADARKRLETLRSPGKNS